jgi:hypothetical protein
MPNLLFRKEFHQSIREQKKTATLRRWLKPRVRQGQLAFSQGIGWLRILSAEPIEWGELTQSDAIADGFGSLADLKRAVLKIYPDTGRDGRAWFRIQFRLEKVWIAPDALTARQPSAKPRRKPKTKPDSRRNKPDATARRLGFVNGPDKARLAQRIRAELDKAVNQAAS